MPETKGVKKTEADKKDEESIKKAQAGVEIERKGALFTPEGIIMLSIAFIIDIIDFLILSIVIMDIAAFLVIVPWIYFHSQRISVTRGAAGRLGKAAKWAKKMRWLRPLLVITECIPIIGMLPLWTLVVYYELKS